MRQIKINFFRLPYAVSFMPKNTQNPCSKSPSIGALTAVTVLKMNAALLTKLQVCGNIPWLDFNYLIYL